MRNHIIPKIFATLLTLCLFGNIGWTQNSLKGKIVDETNEGLIGANVLIVAESVTGTTTDLNGNYELNNLKEGILTLQISYTGFEDVERTVTIQAGQNTLDVVMEEGAFGLDEVIVTGVFNQRTKLESSVAITTLSTQKLENLSANSTADIFAAIPGNFTDNTNGEVEGIIFPRGLATGSAGNGTGYRYISLQEDGLPVMSTLVGYSSADIYFRNDINIARLEAVRGGSSSIASANSPGGIYNFISKEGKDKFSGSAKITYGIQGNGNSLIRPEVNINGPINDKGWYYSIGGFYRVDEGLRDVPFNANQGGQAKFNIVKRGKKGKLKIYGKYLDDKVTVFRNLPFQFDEFPEYGAGDFSPFNVATENDRGEGFDLNYSSTLSDVKTSLPDGEFVEGNPNATRDYDSSKGVKVKSYSLGMEFTRALGNGWLFKNNARYSYLKNRYNQVTGEQLLGVDFLGGLPTFIKDAKTGEELYNTLTGVNKIGPRWMIAAPQDTRNSFNDFSDQLSFNKEFANHNLSAGVYFATAKFDARWDVDIMAQVLEPNARNIEITSLNLFAALGVPGQDIMTPMQWTDESGFFGYGNLSYVNFDSRSTTSAIFVNDLWEVNDKLNIDVGLRYENINHKGNKAGWKNLNITPFGPAGPDGDVYTRYDNTQRVQDGQFEFDFNHNYFSGSIGLNYKLTDKSAVYGRFTRGNKAPDIDFYIYNYVNSPIEKGSDEKITQAEFGYKVSSSKATFTGTVFYSQISDLSFTRLVTDPAAGNSFFTPPTFNTSTTTGIEIEGAFNLGNNFRLDVVATLQNPKLTDFDVYNIGAWQHDVFVGESYPAANPNTGLAYTDTEGNDIPAGTPSDDFIVEQDGNSVDRIPKVMLNITPAYTIANKLDIYLNWRFFGKRPFNKGNIIDDSAYSLLNAGIVYKLNNNIEIAARVSNLLNDASIIGLGGLGLPGAPGAQDLTLQNLQDHRSAGLPFWGRPQLPRSIQFTLGYKF